MRKHKKKMMEFAKLGYGVTPGSDTKIHPTHNDEGYCAYVKDDNPRRSVTIESHGPDKIIKASGIEELDRTSWDFEADLKAGIGIKRIKLGIEGEINTKAFFENGNYSNVVEGGVVLVRRDVFPAAYYVPVTPNTEASISTRKMLENCFGQGIINNFTRMTLAHGDEKKTLINDFYNNYGTHVIVGLSRGQLASYKSTLIDKIKNFKVEVAGSLSFSVPIKGIGVIGGISGKVATESQETERTVQVEKLVRPQNDALEATLDSYIDKVKKALESDNKIPSTDLNEISTKIPKKIEEIKIPETVDLKQHQISRYSDELYNVNRHLIKKLAAIDSQSPEKDFNLLKFLASKADIGLEKLEKITSGKSEDVSKTSVKNLLDNDFDVNQIYASVTNSASKCLTTVATNRTDCIDELRDFGDKLVKIIKSKAHINNQDRASDKNISRSDPASQYINLDATLAKWDSIFEELTQEGHQKEKDIINNNLVQALKVMVTAIKPVITFIRKYEYLDATNKYILKNQNGFFSAKDDFTDFINSDTEIYEKFILLIRDFASFDEHTTEIAFGSEMVKLEDLETKINEALSISHIAKADFNETLNFLYEKGFLSEYGAIASIRDSSDKSSSANNHYVTKITESSAIPCGKHNVKKIDREMLINGSDFFLKKHDSEYGIYFGPNLLNAGITSFCQGSQSIQSRRLSTEDNFGVLGGVQKSVADNDDYKITQIIPLISKLSVKMNDTISGITMLGRKNYYATKKDGYFNHKVDPLMKNENPYVRELIALQNGYDCVRGGNVSHVKSTIGNILDVNDINGNYEVSLNEFNENVWISIKKGADNDSSKKVNIHKFFSSSFPGLEKILENVIKDNSELFVAGDCKVEGESI